MQVITTQFAKGAHDFKLCIDICKREVMYHEPCAHITGRFSNTQLEDHLLESLGRFTYLDITITFDGI